MAEKSLVQAELIVAIKSSPVLFTVCKNLRQFF
jgi:hypothetical protein